MKRARSVEGSVPTSEVGPIGRVLLLLFGLASVLILPGLWLVRYVYGLNLEIWFFIIAGLLAYGGFGYLKIAFTGRKNP